MTSGSSRICKEGGGGFEFDVINCSCHGGAASRHVCQRHANVRSVRVHAPGFLHFIYDDVTEQF